MNYLKCDNEVLHLPFVCIYEKYACLKSKQGKEAKKKLK